MPEMVTQSEFSRRMGWSPPNTSKYVSRGIIELENGLLNFEKSKKAIEEKTTRVKTQKAKDEIGIPDENSNDISFNRIKTLHESLRAKRTKLELEMLEGKLVDAELVKRITFDKARLTRDTFMSIADRLAPLLANESDTSKVYNIINDEVTFCLNRIDGKSQSFGNSQ